MTPAKVRNQDLGRLRLKVTSVTLARAGEDRQGLTPWLSYYKKENKTSRLRPGVEGFECQAKEFGFLSKRKKQAKIF